MRFLFIVVIALVGALSGKGGTNDGVVTALGRLQPRGGVVRVAAPYSLQGPSLIPELLVQVGDRVTNGTALARTHTHDAARAQVRRAAAEVEVRQARLKVVEAGLKPAEISALAAEAARERADFSEATTAWNRAQRLSTDGTISAQDLELAEARWLATSNRVQAATQRLAAGAEVRAVDLQLARAEVGVAAASLEQAERELATTVIRAPADGEVLALLVRPGELAPQGLLEFGDTSVMEVKAEVYESDVHRLRAGQRAEVAGDAFDGALRGVVTEVGRQVRPNRLLNADPAAFADNRVVEVTLRVEQGETVAGYTGAMVRVRFLP